MDARLQSWGVITCDPFQAAEQLKQIYGLKDQAREVQQREVQGNIQHSKQPIEGGINGQQDGDPTDLLPVGGVASQFGIGQRKEDPADKSRQQIQNQMV